MMPPINQVLQNIMMIRKNPSQLPDLLLQRGAITKQQYDQMKQQGISNNPEAIGQYMMNQGSFSQQQVMNAYQNSAMPIQNSLNQN